MAPLSSDAATLVETFSTGAWIPLLSALMVGTEGGDATMVLTVAGGGSLESSGSRSPSSFTFSSGPSSAEPVRDGNEPTCLA